MKKIVKKLLAATVWRKKTALHQYGLYVRQKKLAAGVDISEDTAYHYTVRVRLFEEFLSVRREKYILCNDINSHFAEDYLSWLKLEKSLGHNYASRQILVLKSVINRAVRDGYARNNRLASYRLSHKRKPMVSLSGDQIRQLEKASLPERLSRVRDLFLFQCYTGLAYIDLKQLDLPPTAGVVISVARQKTQTESLVFYGPKEHALAARYGSKLPVISNQRYNVYLKEIALIMGWNVSLTTHVARKTAAQLWLDSGISLEVVSKMLGHTDTKMTLSAYGSISKKRIIDELKRAA